MLFVLCVVIFVILFDVCVLVRCFVKYYLVILGVLDGCIAEVDVWIDKLTFFKVDGFEYFCDVLMLCIEFLVEVMIVVV